MLNFGQSISGSLRKQSIRIRDATIYSRWAEFLSGAGALVRSYLMGNSPAGIGALGLSLRRLPLGALLTRARARMETTIALAPDAVICAHDIEMQRWQVSLPLKQTTILKAPGDHGERGVIYCQFETNWGFLAQSIKDLDRLLSQYDLICGASWTPTDILPLARILSTVSGAIYLHPARNASVERLSTLHPRLLVIPQIASEFQDPAAFEPQKVADRDIDLLVVSNWAPFKRHWELFRALTLMPKSLRVVCVGQPDQGYRLSSVQELAKLYKVPQEITYYERIPIDEVHKLQSRSKAAAIFSRREGQCIAGVEALFAGASLGMRKDARVGTAAYINPMTGMLLDSARMSSDLMQLIEGAADRQPREWALANIGCDVATTRLNTWLKARAAERGLPWTTDIVRHWWAPYPWVGDADNRVLLTPAAAELHSRYPKTFAVDMLESSRY